MALVLGPHAATGRHAARRHRYSQLWLLLGKVDKHCHCFVWLMGAPQRASEYGCEAQWPTYDPPSRRTARMTLRCRSAVRGDNGRSSSAGCNTAKIDSPRSGTGPRCTSSIFLIATSERSPRGLRSQLHRSALTALGWSRRGDRKRLAYWNRSRNRTSRPSGWHTPPQGDFSCSLNRM
jgi:hypothetical protein